MDTGSDYKRSTNFLPILGHKVLLLVTVFIVSILMLMTWLSAFAAPTSPANRESLTYPAAPNEIDLTIQKSAVPQIFTVGTGNQYSIVVAATGSIVGAVQVVVQDQLPDGITVANPSTDITGDKWNCATSTTTEVNCIYLEPISSDIILAPIIMNVTVAPDVAPSVTNTARLLTDDSNPRNNQDTITTVIDSVDLELSKKVEPQYADVDELILYTLELTNNGPTTAQGVEIIDLMPLGVDYDCTASTSTKTGAPCIPDLSGTDNITVTWDIGIVNKDETITLTLPARPTLSASGKELVNTATASSTNKSDWDTSNNEASAELYISGLEISKSVDKTAVNVGDHFTYTIGITNTGSQTANSVRVQDAFDLAVDVVEAAYRVNNGSWTSFNTGNNMNRFIGNLNTDDTATVLVKVRGNDTVAVSSTVTNTASVTAAPSIVRPSNVVTTTIDIAADLEVDKSDGPDEVTAGEAYSYTLYVDNIGSISATNIIVTDTLSQYLRFTNFDPGSLTMTPTYTTTRVRSWEIGGDWLANESFSFDIGVRVVDNAPPGGIVNNTIQASTTSTETWTANNVYTTNDTDIVAPPSQQDMRIELSVKPSQATIGEYFYFTVEVRNTGDEAATDVVIFDEFPFVLDITGVSTTRGTATTNASIREVTVRIPTLNPNQEVKVTISTRVNSTATGVNTYSHRSQLSWNPNNRENSNSVTYRVVTSTLPGTGGMRLAPWSPFVTLILVIGTFLISLGIATLFYSLWTRKHRPLWTALFGRAGVIFLAAGLMLLFVGATRVGSTSQVPELARLPSTRLPASSILPTSPAPNSESLSSGVNSLDNNENWAPTPTPSSLPDYPIPEPDISGESDQDNLDTSPIQRIIIPRLAVDTIVKYVPFNGQSWLIGGLKQEVAWMGETSWPGLGGNTGLAGHIDLFDGSDGPFRYLSELKPGDEVLLYTEENIYSYKVREQVIVPDYDMSVINPSKNPQLTLITCTGWDNNLRVYLDRLVVFSDLVAVRAIGESQSALPLESISFGPIPPKVVQAAVPDNNDQTAANQLEVYKTLTNQLINGGIDPYSPGKKVIMVDQASQQMHIFEDEHFLRTLPVSTGRPEYFTPGYLGHVRFFADTIHTEGEQYADDAWYVFENAGRIYIHGAPYELDSNGNKMYLELEHIGRQAASHGCIRLYPRDAEWLTQWNPEGAAIWITEPGIFANSISSN